MVSVINNNGYAKATRKEILIHSIIFLLFVFLFWFLYAYDTMKDFISFARVFLYALSYGVILLFNIHYIFGKLYLNRRFVLYIVITISSFLLGYLFQNAVYANSVNECMNFNYPSTAALIRDVIINILTFTMLGGVGLAFMLLHLWNKTQKQMTELQNLTLKIELQNLKNQVSPHFLFNTLNNLYILSKTNNTQAAETILNLADIMRYQLIEAQKENVSLIQEIDYIRNLLDLEKIRRDNLIIKFEMDIHNENIPIQPMLFSTLVENAIKHGSQQMNDCNISIKIESNARTINFIISNTKPTASSNLNNTGTGLINLRRRLDISYPKKYNLELIDNKSTFTATLKIMDF
ncbi:MAG: histidine kinase [Ignavibacteria bacterium]|nr:histidine kinase [Ignavibacteria bacterium]